MWEKTVTSTDSRCCGKYRWYFSLSLPFSVSPCGLLACLLCLCRFSLPLSIRQEQMDRNGKEIIWCWLARYCLSLIEKEEIDVDEELAVSSSKCRSACLLGWLADWLTQDVCLFVHNASIGINHASFLQHTDADIDTDTKEQNHFLRSAFPINRSYLDAFQRKNPSRIVRVSTYSLINRLRHSSSHFQPWSKTSLMNMYRYRVKKNWKCRSSSSSSIQLNLFNRQISNRSVLQLMISFANGIGGFFFLSMFIHSLVRSIDRSVGLVQSYVIVSMLFFIECKRISLLWLTT